MEEKTEMDRGMGQIPPDKHPGILKTAHKYKIDENDPTWILVNLVVESLGGIEKITNAGTKALREASVAVTNATAAEVKSSREKASLEIAKMQESAKANIAGALGTILENKIRDAVDRLQSQSNRPLHKKWLAVMAVLLPIAAGLGGWGLWSFYAYSKNVGAVNTAAYANPVSKSFFHLMECDQPGWEKKWSRGGKELWCYPHADKAGNQYGWRIR
ncbi:hypothetical protein LptCag_1386 [Leptospirillum ferriphilum]|uniref:Uncharacterized protein n=2 Tax=Leptospirillum TaxID=179 RepID=A0A094YKD7_9BACT|nr:hypothetical protein [Leptospirillum ferriphilum]EDZ37957.1 MAG: Hypothetical protein CGL2_10608006 [Leptospirillum sp. Group II '5-way CG']KGA93676.1 hypothetical protein LptCag_1386 [Leptospirillum ferriphilum]